MKMQSANRIQKVYKVILTSLCLMLIISSFLPSAANAITDKEIDASVDAALERFHYVNGGKEFATSAKGLLILPNVFKGGFIIGAEYGVGALRVVGKTVDYYSISAVSFGLLAGAQKKDIIIAFMTEEALRQFRRSTGWEAGVDGNIALITIGGGERIDTTTTKDPIVAFVFDVKGLIVDISLKGSKFTKMIESNGGKRQ